MQRDLDGGHYGEVPEEWSGFYGGAFFAEANELELAALIREGEDLRDRCRRDHATHLGCGTR